MTLFVAGVIVTLLSLVVWRRVEHLIGWPEGHLFRRFERRIARLRRRARKTLT